MEKYYEDRYKYINGNYVVTFVGGKLTKEAFRVNEELVSEFPDSIDLKLTNRCSNGCPFCHENSVPNGKVFDLERTKKALSQLPELPIEIAIGGGNIMENLDEIKELTDWLRERGNLIRGTIKLSDIIRASDEDFEKLMSMGFGAIGLSIEERDLDFIIPRLDNTFHSLFTPRTIDLAEDPVTIRLQKMSKSSRLVLHIIAGLFPPKRLGELFNTEIPILILGYKQYGRAKNDELPESIPELEKEIASLIFSNRIQKLSNVDNNKKDVNKKVLAFDNLSLNQLHVKKMLLQAEWERLYMGEEGQHSMYVDAVDGKYAKNSTSDVRESWDNIGLIEYFKSIRNG